MWGRSQHSLGIIAAVARKSKLRAFILYGKACAFLLAPCTTPATDQMHVMLRAKRAGMLPSVVQNSELYAGQKLELTKDICTFSNFTILNVSSTFILSKATWIWWQKLNALSRKSVWMIELECHHCQSTTIFHFNRVYREKIKLYEEKSEKNVVVQSKISKL